MNGQFEKARNLLHEFKGDRYVFGLGCFDKLGALAARAGKRATVFMSGLEKAWGKGLKERTMSTLSKAGVTLAGDPAPGARPNSPREDVVRMAEALQKQNPDTVVAVGGGSTIDAAKAAIAMTALGRRFPDIEAYFGINKVSAMCRETGAKLLPLVAVETNSSSGAHLTKYANITDMKSGQKKLFNDEAIVPAFALFDYSLTASMSQDLTADGGLDGIAHCLEVYYGCKGDALKKAEPVSLLGIELIVGRLRSACEAPGDLTAREALGLGTDLGGYAIMIGSTNGAHLASFSMVDILAHGRACALMNPYYTVFFAPAVERQLKAVAAIYKKAGYLTGNPERFRGRDLGLAVAEAMITLSKAIHFPTTLKEVNGFSDDHILRALAAAKDPVMDMKLKGMPVPLTADRVDEYMGPVLEAAKQGDFSIIKNMRQRK